jgi:hypothetical protein
MKQWIALMIAASLTVSCARAQLALRYLSPCPAKGPETAADFVLRPVPVDLDDFYSDVGRRGSAFEISELGAVNDGGARRPILAIRHQGSEARREILVVAGIHGNETAGLLTVPAILDLLETKRPEHEFWDMTVIAPANPIGAKANDIVDLVEDRECQGLADARAGVVDSRAGC